MLVGSITNNTGNPVSRIHITNCYKNSSPQKYFLDFAKMIVIRSFNRLVDFQKERPFVRRHRNIHFLILSLPILLMDFENIMKIISYFQFIHIISHFEMILKESMVVKTSKNSIEKPAFSDAGFKNMKIFLN